MATQTMADFVYLCNAQWADPESMTEHRGIIRVAHVPVAVYRNRVTRQLEVILCEDEGAVNPPRYIVEDENHLIWPAGGMPG